MAAEELAVNISALADDMEINRVSAVDAFDRLFVLSQRVEELTILTGLDTRRVQTNVAQALHQVTQLVTRRLGRHAMEIPVVAIEGYLRYGLKVKEIAGLYGVHRNTTHKKMEQNGLSISAMYSAMTDAQLDTLVLEIHREHPQCGYRMIRAHLQSRGHLLQIFRVQESLRRVDPEGTELRALANRTLYRRQYSVPAPNCMWHIDGNHKLIRWRFIIHGGIDGFSRLVVYLTADTNNRADTVLHAFLDAVRQYGLPSRVRSDKGGENFEVAHFMVQTQGENRNSHITGRSVHNQRLMSFMGQAWMAQSL
ncbi:uncharacterized protein LOC125722239 isoform X3 [Brienomyrus brachyistius]|uniref:uncharacterized protein LOC125722239 isoform X3 n=1 Tax=Brienomyrus brachyistius TaxID=42636 RepID=UPI0020B1F151|nr:uncharacterized protein LOC125722239 isoform X3 [Brienomyrus brachyistius]